MSARAAEDAADTEVDAELGYPPAYAALCRHAHATGLPLMPFLEGPPQRFLPYAPLPDEFAQLKDWDTVFPVVAEKEKDSSGTRKFAEGLWQQLDHLGNAGFDPATFRVDPYGNVVYWNADPSSPLAWDVDYWFPHPRGGKPTLPNLRIVQWQAYLRKRNRLEFIVPWWDLQHGCSINQFLSAFAAKNADFRKRSFALFFAGGEDESVAREHVGECRPWPQQFREKKALCGLAAAAIVSGAKETPDADSDPANSSDVSRILGAYPYGAILAGAPPKRIWSAEEEEAVKRGMSKFGPGSWKETKEDEIALANRSVAQIKEKFRLMRGVSRSVTRENGRGGLSGRQSTATTALQKELRVKIMREEERREREEELTQLEATVARLKVENERERAKAAELEALLKKHKQRVEKQRKWAESQASYRLCLERVLRDTMHQTMTYKEQARLTREACNALIARLDSQRAACEAMEHELLQRHSQREILEAAAAGGGATATKLITQGRDIVDVSSCVSLDDDEEEEENLVNEMSEISDEDDDDDELYNLRIFRVRQVARKSLVRHAIKVAMEVEDTKETVDDSQWDMPPKPPCPIQASRHTAPGHDGDSETPGSESDSDFADDEMSPAIRVISRDDDDVDDDADKKLVSELSQFHDGPTSELRDFCSRNSKPGDSCVSTIEDVDDAPGESSDQSKQLEVVQQKDVIMVQQKEEVEEEDPGSCKQESIDALLQRIRFQIPTSEAGAEPESGHAYISENHLDELLEQVLKTQLDSVQKPEIKEQQEPADDVDDEKLKEIGKSNLDKWLHSLLFKETESVCSSPGRELPIPDPALTQLSRELLILHRDSGNADHRPRSGLWGALLRKLSVKHHEEEESSSSSSPSSSTSKNRHFEPGKEDYDMVDEAQNVQTAMNSLLKSSPSDNSSSTLAEGRSCVTLPGWPGGNPKMGAIASNYWPKDADHSRSMKRTDHGSRRPLSDVEEMSETGSFTESPKPERKDLQVHRHKRRVSIKVAGFVGWKKSSTKRSSAESRPQPDHDQLLATDVMEP